MISKKSDDAVSPVIGVMLMLVVTVVIAAAVTIFATGVVGETEPAPVAVLDVEIFNSVFALDGASHGAEDTHGPDFWITHVSGEAVDTKDIELRLSWTHDGCSHYSTYSASEFKKTHENGVSGRSQPMYVKTIVKDSYRKDFGTSKPLDYFFGDVILTPGMKLTATADFLSLSEENKGSPFMNAIFDKSNEYSNEDPKYGIMKHLQPGTAVDVMIIHLPSNKAIYDNTVIVQ